MNQPVLTRSHFAPFFKLTVKIAEIFVAYINGNFLNPEIRLKKQLDSHLEPLFHQKLPECMAGFFFDNFAHGGQGLVEIIGQLA